MMLEDLMNINLLYIVLGSVVAHAISLSLVKVAQEKLTP
jgi:hypothetical protein